LHQLLRNQLCDVASEWWTAAEHVISDRAERINICARIELNSGLHLLGRHVFGSANDAARGWSTSGSYVSFRIDNLCETKVSDLYEAVFAGSFGAAMLH
jgi:hypothetical protein